MKVLVVGYLFFERNSQRGINVISEVFAEVGAQVDFYSYPIYLWRILGRNSKTLERKLLIGKGIVNNKRAFVLFPYSSRFSKLFIGPLRQLSILSHELTIPRIDFSQYDIVVIESGKPVFLAKNLNHPRIIYRMSDPILSLAPELFEYEKQIIQKAVLVLSPNNMVKNVYSERLPDCASKIHTWVNGFTFQESEQMCNPYILGTKNVLYLGLFPIDWDLLTYLCKNMCDVNFHVVGPHSFPRNLDIPHNLKLHGYLPHEKTYPFVKYADAFILPYKDIPQRLKYMELTSKILLFMKIGKPIIANSFTNAGVLEKFGIIIAKSNCSFVNLLREALNGNIKPVYNVDFDYYNISRRKEELIRLLLKHHIIES
ncbi:MAG: hypothetical protein Kow0084_20210 [Pseudothermotoga elfii]